MCFAQYLNVNDMYLFFHQWNICSILYEILKVFKDSTEGVYYLTSNLVALILN